MPFWDLGADRIAELGVFFAAGGLLSLLPLPSEQLRNRLVLGFLLALVASLLVNGWVVAKFFLLPPLVIYFGTLRYPYLSHVRKVGDISYGVYLWGFVVQQFLAYFLHPGHLTMMALSIPITYVLGFLSWHLLEKRALRLKLPRAEPELVAGVVKTRR
ncbi:hypothetical protein [Hymenobacter sp. BT491]|uniref:hypothetical protein n=1 Tax=Hymenobacter sp. BT491 TaxID=2766779 RepID=UPI0016534643|nr:hypothetical protein [Hymenobacter sp. BT491]MBC6989912.1 hypothetical protein [Hymenobacter sp. BT491]